MSVSLTILILPVVLGLARFVDAVGATSSLQVVIPPTITRESGYDNRPSLFGIPPYGGSIEERVYYADQDLCNATVDTTIGFPQRQNNASWQAPFILLVDRGGCTFVRKVRNAQHAGAAAVIIADNKCLCRDGDSCTPEDEEAICELKEPIMSDDGSGADISIPSFLMFKEDSDLIRQELKRNTMVRIKMSWNIPTTDDRVEYHLFTTPTDVVTRQFQWQFKAAALALGDKAKFTPTMVIFDGIKAGCQGYDGTNQCGSLCTNNGRYCSSAPDEEPWGSSWPIAITGADVVTESLRRACIWNTYGQDGVGEKWWTYVQEFMYRCPDYFTDEDCISDCYNRSGVDKLDIDACTLDSGGLEADVANSVLDAQLGEREANGVVVVPSMYVNSARLSGALDFASVLKAVCAQYGRTGYVAALGPVVCRECVHVGSADLYDCVTQGNSVGSTNSDLQVAANATHAPSTPIEAVARSGNP